MTNVGSQAPSSPGRRKSGFLSVAVVTLLVPGVFATVALPAYAFQSTDGASEAAAAVEQFKVSDAQSVTVAGSVGSAAVSRDSFSATTAEELAAERARVVAEQERAVAEQERAAAQQERASLAASYSAYSGPTASDYLANPPYPSFDLAQVANVALQYQGVPYVYGGSTPAGFDCSGFVAFVYAQFGVSLPHSVSGAAAQGTPIPTSAALPGDIVIMAGHSGIYLGDGIFIDAPDFGRTVSVRPIYDSFSIVRIGI